MRYIKFLSHGIFVLGMLFSSFTFATPQSFSYQGRILRANGSPLENNNVQFLFQVLDQAGSCVLFQEQLTGYSMVNSGGIFDLNIGINSRQFVSGGVSDWTLIFRNSGSYTCGDCVDNGVGGYACSDSLGPAYTPGATDIRKLRVSFNDGTGWKVITPDNEIRSVPYASMAQRSATSDRIGVLTEADLLTKALAPTCVSANSFLQWNGTDFDCVSVSSLGAADIPNLDASKITSGTITNNVVNTSTTSATGSFGTASANSVRLYDGTSEYLVQVYSSGGTGYTITWPANQGAAGTVLQNDGSGNLSWVALPPSSVTSVAGRTGAVTLSNSDIAGLGTVATLNVAATGDAAATEVVKGDDTRLTNGRAPTGSAGGDLSGTYPNPTVAQIQGRAVSATAPSAVGQALLWDGSEWHANFVRAQDLRNSWGGDQMIPTSSCSANQAMVWSAITDRFTCQNIANLDAAVISSGILATARLGSGTADNTTYLRGDGTWAALTPDPNTILNGGNTFGSDVTIGSNDGQNLNFETSGTNRFSILQNGQIVTNNASPTFFMDITPVPGYFSVARFKGGTNNDSLVTIESGTGTGKPALSFNRGSTVYQIYSDGRLIFNPSSNFNSPSVNSAAFTTTGLLGIKNLNPTSALDVNGDFILRGMTDPGVSPASQGRIFFDSVTNKFKVSENGNSYVDLIPTGGAGDILNGGNTTGNAVTIGTNDSYALNFETGGTTRMSISSAGDIGLGASSVSGTKLRIYSGAIGGVAGYGEAYYGDGYGLYGRNTGAFGTWSGAGVYGHGVAAIRGEVVSGGVGNTGAALIGQTSNLTTDGQLLRLQHRTSNFSGTAFLSDMASGTGVFTGQFIELKNAGVTRLQVTSTGAMSVGGGAPRAQLDVNGALVTKAATVNTTSEIDFSVGNIQYTDNSCGSFQLNNLKDGGSYTFAVKGTAVATCSFTAFSDNGSTSLTVKMPPDHGATTSGKHTLYNMMVIGTDVYVAWTPGY